MMYHVYMIFLQIIFGILVIVFILLQSRGAGLGTVWGGGGELYGTRRGIEKMLFKVTIALVALFALVSLAQVVKF